MMNHSLLRKLIVKFSSLIILNLSILITMGTAIAASTTGDIQPPVIHIISPEDGQKVDTGKPQVMIEFYDAGSGVDQSTIRVIIDKNDLTAQVLTQSNLSNQNIQMESATTPFTIFYKPSIPLTQGYHEILFIVKDKSGNLAEAQRSFQIQTMIEGTQLGVTNTFTQDWQPDKKMTDLLDLGIQSQIAGMDLRLETAAKATNFPTGLSPFYHKDEYNAYLEQYVLNLKKGGFDLTWGYSVTPVESELLQVGRDIQGLVATDTEDSQYGTNQLGLFSGKITTSYGIGIAVYNFSGVVEQWEGKSGLELSGMYGSIGNTDGYDFVDINVLKRLGDDVDLQWELIHGLSKLDKSYSDAFSGHFDIPWGGIHLGFDLVDFQPNYALPGPPAQYLPDESGLRSWGIRMLTPLFRQSFLSINGIYTYDNLDGSYADTTRRINIDTDYSWVFSSSYSLDLNYQSEVKECAGPVPVGTVDHRYLLTFAKQWISSYTKLSYTREKYLNYYGTDSKEYQHLLGSWTKTVGVLKLTPSLEWIRSLMEKDNMSFEARFTVEAGFWPDMSNSRLAVYHQKSVTVDGVKNVDGAELHLSMRVWKNSSLQVNIQNNWWNQLTKSSQGLDTVYSLEWVWKL